MSMALRAGFIVAYPMNWWLVANHFKHGMMTVRKHDQAEDNKSIQVHQMDHHGDMSGSDHATDTAAPFHNHNSSDHSAPQPSARRKAAITLLPCVGVATGLAVVFRIG